MIRETGQTGPDQDQSPVTDGDVRDPDMKLQEMGVQFKEYQREKEKKTDLEMIETETETGIETERERAEKGNQEDFQPPRLSTPGESKPDMRTSSVGRTTILLRKSGTPANWPGDQSGESRRSKKPLTKKGSLKLLQKCLQTTSKS